MLEGVTQSPGALGLAEEIARSLVKEVDRMLADEIQPKKLALGVPDVVQDQDGSSLANLKYAKSKYKNVESLMKYLESGAVASDISEIVPKNFFSPRLQEQEHHPFHRLSRYLLEGQGCSPITSRQRSSDAPAQT